MYTVCDERNKSSGPTHIGRCDDDEPLRPDANVFSVLLSCK